MSVFEYKLSVLVKIPEKSLAQKIYLQHFNNFFSNCRGVCAPSKTRGSLCGHIKCGQIQRGDILEIPSIRQVGDLV